MKVFFTLMPFFIRHKWAYIWGILAVLAADFMQMLTPKILGFFTDDLQTGQLTSVQTLLYGLVIVAISLITAVFRYLWRMNLFGAARHLEYELRDQLFRHYQAMSSRFFTQHKTGDLMAHATNDIQAVRMSAGMGFLMLIDAVFLTVTVIAIMAFTIDWHLTLASLLPLPLMTLVTARLGQTIHRRFRATQEAFSSLTNTVQENISGIRVVKAFVQERAEIEKFQKANQQNLKENLQLIRADAFFQPLVQLIAGISFLIALGYGGALTIYDQISLGDFVAFNTYLGLLIWPMKAIGWMVNNLQRGAASLIRLNQLLNVAPEITDEPQNWHASRENPSSAMREIEGQISFHHLTFTYPGAEKPALKEFHLTIEKGETLGIIGRTGSGKSTLAGLLVRLYDAPPGTLFIDGRDIREIPLKILREQIGYVPQENFLFSDTITENIAFGLDQYTPEQVAQAAEDAQVLNNILAFPKRFETVVGERGVTLSGGQKQRISIARALIKNPRILILDDALSAVDTQTEEAILRRLRRIMKERTSILISHRVSTIQEADKIIVMDHGRIVEQGDHESLLTHNGLYAHLYRQQLLEAQLVNET